MNLSKVMLSLSLWLGIAFVSCSKQDPEVSSAKPVALTQSNYSGPTETIQFNADLGFNEELRALDGTKFYRGRLRPQITDGTVEVKMYIGSQAMNMLSPQTLNFQYDEKSNSIFFRGQITLPEGLLSATDLRMLMLVSNNNQVSGSSLNIQNTIKSEFFDNGTFADGTPLSDIKVPYSTGWLDVSSYVEGKTLDVLRTKVLLKPLGHVIKLELDTQQTALSDIKFLGFRIESTAITDMGSYALPQTYTQIGNVGDDLVFTPRFDTTAQGATKKIGSIELDAQEKSLTTGSSQTIFVWVEQIPTKDLQAPYNSKTSRWTRTFAKIKKPQTVIDHTFTKAWWDGFDGVDIPVYYTNNDFSKKGSTMSMILDNPKVISPIDRVAYTYAANRFLDRGTNDGYYNEDLTPNLGEWVQRQWTYVSLYSWGWLASQNYVGDSHQTISFSRVYDPNSSNVKFRVPTLEELAVILPTQSVKAGLRFGADGTPIQVQTERVKLGNSETAPNSYAASYQSYGDIQNYPVALGVRFMGGDDRYKTVYQYRGLDVTSKGTAANQVQTYYLGSFYPEIQSPQEYRDFSTNNPDATAPPITSERVLPMNSRLLVENAGSSNFKGNTYWVRNTSGDKATYVSVNYSSTTENVEVKTQDKTSEVRHTLIVVRDF